jgi:outer membrane protein TolC
VTTSNSPVANPFLTGAGAGVASLTSHQFVANSTYLEGFPTGTNFIVTQNNTRLASNGANTFNPSVTSTLNMTVQQNLLRGLGLLPNRRFILVAKNTKLASDYAFKQQILTTVTQVELDYWELVFARQFVGVEQKVLEAANKLLSDNQKQVQIGTLAPLDVTSAEANVASANQGLINAQTAVLQDQTILLAAITKNPLVPELTGIEIVPTDNTYMPPVTENLALADAVKEALTNRPDYQQSLINLKSDDINVRATKNELLPSLLLQGNYGWTGLGGIRTISGGVVPNTFVADLNEPIVNGAGTPIGGFVPLAVVLPSTTSTTGVGSAFSQIVHGQFPNYGAQINFQLPIRNRSAQADNITAMLTQRQDVTRLQQQQNAIAVDVSNAQISLRQARATLLAAQATVRFQQQALDAENKKLQYGTSTSFQVVQQQQLLATDESQEVRAEVNLVEAKVQFDRAMARTFTVNNIEVQSAKRVSPSTNPMIPGTASTGELLIAPLANDGSAPAVPVDGNSVTAPKRDPRVQQQQ